MLSVVSTRLGVVGAVKGGGGGGVVQAVTCGVWRLAHTAASSLPSAFDHADELQLLCPPLDDLLSNTTLMNHLRVMERARGPHGGGQFTEDEWKSRVSSILCPGGGGRLFILMDKDSSLPHVSLWSISTNGFFPRTLQLIEYPPHPPPPSDLYQHDGITYRTFFSINARENGKKYADSAAFTLEGAIAYFLKNFGGTPGVDCSFRTFSPLSSRVPFRCIRHGYSNAPQGLRILFDGAMITLDPDNPIYALRRLYRSPTPPTAPGLMILLSDLLCEGYKVYSDPRDPVRRFHEGNGADPAATTYLPMADRSPTGWQKSFCVQASYNYDAKAQKVLARGV